MGDRLILWFCRYQRTLGALMVGIELVKEAPVTYPQKSSMAKQLRRQFDKN